MLTLSVGPTVERYRKAGTIGPLHLCGACADVLYAEQAEARRGEYAWDAAETLYNCYKAREEL